jgi:hypothetical protein
MASVNKGEEKERAARRQRSNGDEAILADRFIFER